SHVDRSIQDSGPFVRTNVVGTQVLLDMARELRVARYVQISTDECYGSLGPTGSFTEETPLAPNSPYAASKAAADLLVRSYVHTFGLPALVTRCSNNYGPYQFPEKLIPLMISNALEDKPLPVYGDGQQVRDWLYVEDHCRAIRAVLEKGASGEIYNIGGNCSLPNLEVIRRILKLTGKPETLVTRVADRPGHDRRYALTNQKLNRIIGWEPLMSFDQGLEVTIDWYRENHEWIERVKSGEYRLFYELNYAQRG
ncbi:MAG: dTDP-glucose 4,6-dehydratase, partial [Acidobacteriaceae bacterium]|nr:dTDP-glucose 4,6-dehydratase [Acidobacteriaceae bacterium]